MLPFVNSLLASPGILRDSLGNSRPAGGPASQQSRRERQNARLLRRFSGLR